MNGPARGVRRLRLLHEPSSAVVLTFFSLALLVSLSAFLSGCGKTGHGGVVAGSTSVQPVMEKIVRLYRVKRPEQRVSVEGGGSSSGIMAAVTGTAILGMSSRELKSDGQESQLIPHCIALDAIALIVHPANPVSELSLAQIRDLFSGRVKSWKDVGGNDGEIHLILREEGSGTRSAFEELVMKVGKETAPFDPFALVQDSSGGLREVVRQDPGAIGFVSLGVVNRDVKALAIDGTMPTLDSVRKKEYKLVRSFFLVSKGPPEGVAKDIVAFATGSETEAILKEEGLVGVGH